MKMLLAGAALLAAAGCGSDESDVDWSHYTPEFHQAVTQAADDGDCHRMGDQFLAAKAKGDGELMAFIDRSMKDSGCP